MSKLHHVLTLYLHLVRRLPFSWLSRQHVCLLIDRISLFASQTLSYFPVIRNKKTFWKWLEFSWSHTNTGPTYFQTDNFFNQWYIMVLHLNFGQKCGLSLNDPTFFLNVFSLIVPFSSVNFTKNSISWGGDR